MVYHDNIMTLSGLFYGIYKAERAIEGIGNYNLTELSIDHLDGVPDRVRENFLQINENRNTINTLLTTTKRTLNNIVIELCILIKDMVNNKIILIRTKDANTTIYERQRLESDNSLDNTLVKWIDDIKSEGFKDIPGEEDRVGFDPPRPKVLWRTLPQ